MSAFFELGIDKSLANSIAEAIAGKKPLKTLQEQNSQIILSEKTDPVDPKEAKKKFKDREDKDLDNDGDSDESDRYLHKRRKAIQKNMKGSKDELDMEPKAKDDGNMSESNLEEASEFGITIKLGEETNTVSEEFWFSDESKNLRKEGWRKV